MKFKTKIFLMIFFVLSAYAEDKPKLININKRLMKDSKLLESHLNGDSTLDGKLVFAPPFEQMHHDGRYSKSADLVDSHFSVTCQSSEEGFYFCTRKSASIKNKIFLEFAIYKKKRYPFDTYDNLMKSFPVSFFKDPKPDYCSGYEFKKRLCVDLIGSFTKEIIPQIPDSKRNQVDLPIKLYLLVTEKFVYFIASEYPSILRFDKPEIYDSKLFKLLKKEKPGDYGWRQGYYIFENEEKIVPVNDRIFHMKNLYGLEDSMKYFKKNTKTPLIQESTYWPNGKINISENFLKYLEMEKEYLQSIK